ncbi:MAG: glycosyltransferase [Planctomycetes bacterium]|nr:glycosyltransferase [Planctomycetota bacterium]
MNGIETDQDDQDRHLAGGRPRGRPRIALYSPGMVGLGHMRRHLLIAQTLLCSRLRPIILMIAESREAGAFMTPPGMDFLTMPALAKDSDGRCRPRHLDIPLEDLVGLRENAIAAALEAFEPDVLIVDHLPRGALRELNPALEYLRSRGRTRCVLGLRDVLGDRRTITQRWRRDANDEAIRDYYDAVWVYGDPVVYDAIREYRFPPDVAAKMCYTGYFDQLTRLRFAQVEHSDPVAALGLPTGRLALCLVGGGQDGARLAETFVHVELPPDTNAVIVTGPFMPPEAQQRLREHAARRPSLRVLHFVTEPALLLRQADRVIAMGGYNTVCEVLSFEKPSLIVPRARRAPEQLIRAERLRRMGLVEVLHPDDVSPHLLGEWLACPKEPPRARDRIDFNGLSRVTELLEEMLVGHLRPAPARPHEERSQNVAP